MDFCRNVVPVPIEAVDLVIRLATESDVPEVVRVFQDEGGERTRRGTEEAHADVRRAIRQGTLLLAVDGTGHRRVKVEVDVRPGPGGQGIEGMMTVRGPTGRFAVDGMADVVESLSERLVGEGCTRLSVTVSPYQLASLQDEVECLGFERRGLIAHGPSPVLTVAARRFSQGREPRAPSP